MTLKSTFFYFSLLFLFVSCEEWEDCNCTPGMKTHMVAQLTFKHGEPVQADSVICRNKGNLWLYKRHDFLDWEYLTFYKPDELQKTDIEIFDATLSDLDRLAPFIQHVHANGMALESISREYDSIFEFKLIGANYYRVQQQYVFNKKGWTLRKNVNIHDEIRGDIDLSKTFK